jgi:WD40 repeat protein
MRIIQYALEPSWAEMGWGGVRSLQFRSDGQELAAMIDSGGDSRIAFWDLQRNVEGKPVNAWGSAFEGAFEGAQAAPVLSPDVGMVARIGYKQGDGGGLHAILSRRSRGKLVDRCLGWWWKKNILAMCFSPDGRRLAVTGMDNDEDGCGEGVALWDIAAVQRARASGPDEPRWVERQAAAKLLPADDFLGSLAFSPDGATLAAGTWNQGVFRWDVATGRQLPGLQLSGPERPWVRRLAFSPDGKLLAVQVNTQKRGPGLLLFDSATAESRPVPGEGHRWSGYADWAFHDFAFQPAGRLLATVALDKTVTFWEAATGKKQQVLTSDVGSLCCIAFSPDGRICAAGGGNGQVVVGEADG